MTSRLDILKSNPPISSPSKNIDFLTQKINEEAKERGVNEEAYSFTFFIRDNAEEIIAGCNGSVIYGAIHTDQLWVHKSYRSQGLGRTLMGRVHDYGRKVGCTMATVSTMSFQEARSFYEHLGYVCDFERPGYSSKNSCFFLAKRL